MERQGRVMRSSSVERSRKTLCTWTVSRNTPTGWALVVPDGDEPVFQIYSEAATPEADALVEYYANMISVRLTVMNVKAIPEPKVAFAWNMD